MDCREPQWGKKLRRPAREREAAPDRGSRNSLTRHDVVASQGIRHPDRGDANSAGGECLKGQKSFCAVYAPKGRTWFSVTRGVPLCPFMTLSTAAACVTSSLATSRAPYSLQKGTRDQPAKWESRSPPVVPARPTWLPALRMRKWIPFPWSASPARCAHH